MNEWAEFVTSWSRGTTLYDVYRYAFSRLLSVGVVNSITFVDTASTCRSTVARDATPCDDGLADGCSQRTAVSVIRLFLETDRNHFFQLRPKPKLPQPTCTETESEHLISAENETEAETVTFGRSFQECFI